MGRKSLPGMELTKSKYKPDGREFIRYKPILGVNLI